MQTVHDFKNILVFNPAFLGDTMLTTPLIKALHKLYPKAKITFCVRPEHVGLYIGLTFIDNVIAFDKRKSSSGLSGTIKFRKYLKSFNFDLVINLHKSIRSTALFLFSEATIIGYKEAALSFLFTYRVHRDMKLHEVLRDLSLTKPLVRNFKMDEAVTLGGSLSCNIDKELTSKAKFYYAVTEPKKKVIGIAPGSVWETKRYPALNFATVANKLYEDGYSIALIGSDSDKEACEEFAKHFKYSYYDYFGKTSVTELPSFLSSLDLLLVNDSGAMHIAVAVGVPCVAIFGATDKSLGFFPYDTKSIVVENNSLTCRPCGKHGGKTCPLGHFKCMLDISPTTVIDATFKIIKGRK